MTKTLALLAAMGLALSAPAFANEEAAADAAAVKKEAAHTAGKKVEETKGEEAAK